jgi:hypothetical protein
MFETSLEKTIILTAIGLWFAQGWYLNVKLEDVHKKLDSVLSNFNGLRNYLYEIDPQFEDERLSQLAFEQGESIFSGSDDLELIRKKELAGKRTLNTSFTD